MTIHDESLFVDREMKLGGFRKLLRPETPQAVMLIKGPQQMGKSWLISKMSLSAELEAGFPVVWLDFRDACQKFQLQTCLGLIRFSRDKLKAPVCFQGLNETINSLTATPAGGVARLKALADKVARFFNLDELRQLAFSLEVDWENLSPRDTKLDAAFSLARYHDQRGILPRLLARIKEQRPNVDWEEGLNLARAEAGVDGAVQDRNEPLLATDDVAHKEAERRLNDAFFRALAALMAERHPIVFLIDSYEDATENARQWIEQELLLRLRDGEINDVVVIITGEVTPSLGALGMDRLVVKTELEPFDEKYIAQYLEKLQIPYYDEDKEKRPTPRHAGIHGLTSSSAGVPGMLAMMTRNLLQAQSDKDDEFFSDV